VGNAAGVLVALCAGFLLIGYIGLLFTREKYSKYVHLQALFHLIIRRICILVYVLSTYVFMICSDCTRWRKSYRQPLQR